MVSVIVLVASLVLSSNLEASNFGRQIQGNLKNLVSKSKEFRQGDSLSSLDGSQSVSSQLQGGCAEPLDIETLVSFVDGSTLDDGLRLDFLIQTNDAQQFVGLSGVSAICDQGVMVCDDPLQHLSCRNHRYDLEDNLTITQTQDPLGNCLCVSGNCAKANGLGSDLSSKQTITHHLKKTQQRRLESQGWVQRQNGLAQSDPSWKIVLTGQVASTGSASGLSRRCTIQKGFDIVPRGLRMMMNPNSNVSSWNATMTVSEDRLSYLLEMGNFDAAALRGNCSVKWMDVDLYIADYQHVRSVVLEEVVYDDWVQVLTSGGNYVDMMPGAPAGAWWDNPVPGGNCEARRMKRVFPNKDLTSGLLDGNMNIRFRLWVEGGGDGGMRMRFHLNQPLCRAIPTIRDGCQQLAEDPDWILDETVVDGITTLSSGAPVAEEVEVCKTLESVCGPVSLCQKGWETMQTHFNQQPVLRHQCRELPRYDFEDGKDLAADGNRARNSDLDGYYDLLEGLSSSQAQRCEVERVVEAQSTESFLSLTYNATSDHLKALLSYHPSSNQYHLELGKNEGNYLSGNCVNHWLEAHLKIADPALIESVTLKYFRYDDLGQLFVANQFVAGDEDLAGQRCEQGTTHAYLHQDLTQYFKASEVPIKLNGHVSGEGEFYAKLVFQLNTDVCRIHESLESSCDAFIADASWRLRGESVDGIRTFENFQPIAKAPNRCRLVNSSCGPVDVCRAGWAWQRDYFKVTPSPLIDYEALNQSLDSITATPDHLLDPHRSEECPNMCQVKVFEKERHSNEHHTKEPARKELGEGVLIATRACEGELLNQCPVMASEELLHGCQPTCDSNDFGRAAASMQALSDLAQQTEQTDQSLDSSSIRVFAGKQVSCRMPSSATNFFDCCNSDFDENNLIWKETCSSEEKALSQARSHSQTVKPSDNRFCSNRYVVKVSGDTLTNVCEEESQTFCTFESPLAKLIQEQGREQLKGFQWVLEDEEFDPGGGGVVVERGADSLELDCRGFTLQELSSLNFSKMDLSKVTQDWMENANFDQVHQQLQTKITEFYDATR